MLQKISLFAVWWIAGGVGFAQTPSFTLHGRIATDVLKPSIRIVLENPKARNAEVATIEADHQGNYEFRDLKYRDYRMVVWIDGKKQDRRDVKLFCRPGAVVSKDFQYGKTKSTLMLYFPAEDPDVVDFTQIPNEFPKEVLREYQAAEADYFNGNTARAVERLEKIAVRAPGFYKVHARLGLIFQDAGCFDDAETEFARASEWSPRSVQSLLNLASIQIRIADLTTDRDAQIGRALETISRALAIKPNSSLAHCLAGAARMKTDSLEQAETSLKRALDINSTMAAARLLLADLYFKQKSWEKAVDNLTIYLEDHPEAQDREVVREMRDEAQRQRPALSR